MRYILGVLEKLDVSFASSNLSVACIATSNPVYLVFSSARRYPCFVVRKLYVGLVQNEFDNLVKIYRLVGDLIPKPLGVVTHQGGDYIIQEGAKGNPWFRITGKYSSEVRWGELRAEIKATLGLFQRSLSASGSFISKVNLENEFKAYFTEFENTNSIDESMLNVVKLYKYFLNYFSSFEDTSITAQNGDFTLNNLLINGREITIIDFEDFNVFKVPYYDNFTMALSLVLHTPSNIEPNFKNEIRFFTHEISKIEGYSGQTMQGFFFMSLIAQLGSWSLGEKRANHRSWLMKILLDFSSDPQKYISSSL